MARAFNGTTDRLDNAAAPVTAVPLTLACWFNPTAVTQSDVLIAITDGSSNNTFRLEAGGAVAGDPVRAITRAAASQANADTSTSISAGSWQHGCAVFSAINARAAYLNGGGKGTNVTSRTPTGINATSLGMEGASFEPYTGLIAEAAVWDAALTDAEVAILALGVSPLLVRPASLVAYWPLIGRNSPENDRVGTFPLTVTGATVADHCRIIRPRGVRYFAVPASLLDKSETDTGSGADSQSIAASFISTDIGSGLDALGVSSAYISDETGSGVDAQGVAASLALADVSAGADLQSIIASLMLSDLGSGSDGQSVLQLGRRPEFVSRAICVTMPGSNSEEPDCIGESVF